MHGHVFTRYPAFLLMIQTKSGSQIIDIAAGTPVDSPAMQKCFSNGLVSLGADMSECLGKIRGLEGQRCVK